MCRLEAKCAWPKISRYEAPNLTTWGENGGLNSTRRPPWRKPHPRFPAFRISGRVQPSFSRPRSRSQRKLRRPMRFFIYRQGGCDSEVAPLHATGGHLTPVQAEPGGHARCWGPWPPVMMRPRPKCHTPGKTAREQMSCPSSGKRQNRKTCKSRAVSRKSGPKATNGPWTRAFRLTQGGPRPLQLQPMT